MYFIVQACEYIHMNKRGNEKTGQEKKRKDNIAILLYKESEEKRGKSAERGWLLTCLIVYLELLTVACITLYIC